MQWLIDNWAMVVAVLFGVSEALALLPWFQSNSVFQLIFNVIKSLAGKGTPPQLK